MTLTFSASSSDQACLYVMDGIGNPVGLLTDFATNSFTFTYDPYGAANLTAGGTGNGAAQNPYLFKAGIQDRATGLVKFGARWYNPTTGAWTQQDTLDAPLDPANANRYAYAGGDPINGMDPTGLYDLGSALGVAGASAIGGAVGGCVGGAVAGLVTAGIASGPACVTAGISGFVGGAVGGFITNSLIQVFE